LLEEDEMVNLRNTKEQIAERVAFWISKMTIYKLLSEVRHEKA